MLAQDLEQPGSYDTLDVDLSDVKILRKRSPFMELWCGTCEKKSVYPIYEEDTTIRVENVHEFGKWEGPS